MTPTRLSERVAGVLGGFAAELSGQPEGQEMAQLIGDLHGPLRVAVAGWMKAGKSTLINALLGADVAATDAGECTRVTTIYRYGPEPSVCAVHVDGSVTPLDFRLGEGELQFSLGMGEDAVSRVEVGWPVPALQQLCFIDTPGLESPTPGLSARARRAITGELQGFGVDAVVYLMRHLHGSDVAFLEAFAASPRAEAGPVNAVAVLARADEIGGGRLDALTAATRVAARYRDDPRLRRLVQTVVPVNGLLAAHAASLDDDDMAALRALALLQPGERALVLSAPEVFVRHPLLADVAPLRRADLMSRLGPYGVRLGAELLASSPAYTAASLAGTLVGYSGIAPLRTLLAERFGARADALRARTALAGADRLARRLDGATGRRLAAAVEEIVANAHELVELGELNRLRQHPPMLPAELLAEAERLLGGSGTSPAERLSLVGGDDGEVAGADVSAAALAAVDRWRSFAERPWPDVAAMRTARTVVRTCEGLVAASIISA